MRRLEGLPAQLQGALMALIIIDQATKYYLPADAATAHIHIAVSIIIASAVYITLYKARCSRLTVAGLVLLAAGGTSNIIDQITQKAILDIFNIGTFMFNLADVYILAGVILLTIGIVKRK